MVKDGIDWHGLQTANLKNVGSSFCLPQLLSSLPSLHSWAPSQIHFRWIHLLLSLQSHSFLRHFGGGGVGLTITVDRRCRETTSDNERTAFFFQLKCSSLICNLPEVLQANSSEPSKQSRLPSHLYRPRTHLPLPTQRNCEGSHVASSVVARRRLNVTIKIINDTILRNVEKITRVNCKNLRQPCSSLRSPQSSSKSQTNSEETHRSFLQRNSVGEQVATKANILTAITKESLTFNLLLEKSLRSHSCQFQVVLCLN